MADQESTTGGNGAADSANDPQVSILAQYIKDLSVENPSSPQVFQWQVQPTVEVQFHINVDSVGDGVHEISLKIEVSARSENGVHFVVDLSYGGLFGIRNVPDEALQPFLLIEAPRLIFPFARQIVAEAVSNAGFPPLLLDPIDFASAYVAQIQAQQPQSGESAGGDTNGSAEPAPSDTPSDA